jgi:C_GCAxxG_C_C family probable redox protein
LEKFKIKCFIKEKAGIRMNTEERVKKAYELHHQGYNCAQAVVGAYSDLTDTDEKTLLKISEGFGGGMGAMQDTCGAVTGMFMLAGMANSAGDVKEKQTKAETYQIVRDLSATFQEKNQSTICRELKGVETGTALRSCDGCIEDAVRIIGELLFSSK